MFLPISVSHLVVCSFIDISLEWFDLRHTFYHLLCICGSENIESHIYGGYALPRRVHTLLFFEQSRMPPFFIGIFIYEGVGWVVILHESS